MFRGGNWRCGVAFFLSSALLLTACSDQNNDPRVDAGSDIGRTDGLVGDSRLDGPKSDVLSPDLEPDLAVDQGPDLVQPDALPPPPKKTGVLRFSVGNTHLRIMALGYGIVRITSTTSANDPPERGWTSTIKNWPQNTLASSDNGAQIEATTDELSIRIDKADGRVAIDDLAGNPIHRELLPTATAGRELKLPLTATAHLYGLGEKVGPLDKRGMSLTMWNDDPLAHGRLTPSTDPLYQSIPFVMTIDGKKARGLYLASTHKSVFDLGKTKADELSIQTESDVLDYYVMTGPTPAKVVEKLTRITGRTPLPPLWAMGYHQCRWSYSPESKVREITTQMRKEKVPCDGIWLDIDYMDGFRSFTWSPTAFPDPAKLLSDLKKDGFKTTVIIDPGIKHDPNGSYDTYNTGVSGEHFIKNADDSMYIGEVWPGDSVFPDFTSPQTRSWWASYVAKLAQTGVQGVWIDMNEPTSWLPGGFPLYSKAAGDGTPTDHRETHNVYALLMAKATRAGLAQGAPDKRPFVLTRAGFAGIQRYATVWTGDMESTWETLAIAPTMLMNMGLSGVTFAGTDVGGYSGGPSGELYARWLQLGTFSPFFRTHSQTGSAPQEPWAFGKEILDISREHIELRYRLLPYLYGLMVRAHKTGEPLLRPLFYDFFDDANAHGHDTQMMVGPSLMAAPIVKDGQRSANIYFPPGLWFDYHSQNVYRGGKTLHLPTPLEKLPLFVRAGGILFSWPLMQYVGEKDPELLVVDVYPAMEAQPNRLELYRDNGKPEASRTHYQQAFYLQTFLGGAGLWIGKATGSYVPTEKRIRIRFHGVKSTPSEVSHGKTILSKLSTRETLETQDGWFYYAEKQTVEVSLPFAASAGEVFCSYDPSEALDKPVTVDFNVTLPGPTSDTLHQPSSLDGWEPNPPNAILTVNGTSATLTRKMQQGEVLRYKYTRGSWSLVERKADCSNLENRELSIKDEGGGVMTVNDTIGSWSDSCP
jgi:alpha-glucosidase